MPQPGTTSSRRPPHPPAPAAVLALSREAPSRITSAKRASRVGRPGSSARSTVPSGSTSLRSTSKLRRAGRRGGAGGRKGCETTVRARRCAGASQQASLHAGSKQAGHPRGRALGSGRLVLAAGRGGAEPALGPPVGAGGVRHVDRSARHGARGGVDVGRHVAGGKHVPVCVQGRGRAMVGAHRGAGCITRAGRRAMQGRRCLQSGKPCDWPRTRGATEARCVGAEGQG